LNARIIYATSIKPPLRQNEFGGTFAVLSFTSRPTPRHSSLPTTPDSAWPGIHLRGYRPDFKLTSTGYDFSAYSQAIKNPITKVAYANIFIPFS